MVFFALLQLVVALLGLVYAVCIAGRSTRWASFAHSKRILQSRNDAFLAPADYNG